MLLARLKGTPAMVLLSSTLLSIALMVLVQSKLPSDLPLNSTDPEGFLLLWTRYSAHLAFIFLLLAFWASTLKRLLPNEVTRSLLKHRRQFGLGFAVAHTFHLTALVLFLVNLEDLTLDAGIAIAGFGYLVAFIMAATSNDWSVRRLGIVPWRRLHSAGINILMLYFFVAFSATLASKGSALYAAYLIFIIAAVTTKLKLRARPLAATTD